MRKVCLLLIAATLAALGLLTGTAQAASCTPDSTWTKSAGSVSTAVDPVPQRITIVVSGHNVSFTATNDPTLAIHDVDVTTVNHGVSTTTHYTSGAAIKTSATVTSVSVWAYEPHC